MNLEIENENVLPDATDADVLSGLNRLTSGRPSFAILDKGTHHYIQTKFLDADNLRLEVRDGGPDRVYQAPVTQTLTTVIEAFISYLHDDNRWRTAVEWRRTEMNQ